MSSVQAYNSVSFGKLFLAFSLILLIALFFISMQTSFKNTEEFGKKLENDITNFFQVFLSIYKVPKRNGKERKISGGTLKCR